MKSSIQFVPPALSLQDAHTFTAKLRGDKHGFRRLAKVLHDKAGIHLPDSEKNLSLMAGRIGPILRQRGLATYDDYAEEIAAGDRVLLTEFISALTTNTTEFFRESAHFEHLAKLAQSWKGRAELRLWCAASSSGQEVWTTLITVAEAMGEQLPPLKMLATDIDREILQKAASTRYTEHEAESIPALYRQKYFTHANDHWYVSPRLTQYVTFAPFNLMTPAYPFQHPFDVVFCRNVLIYFDRPTVAEVLRKLSATLGPGGHLYLGHSEAGTLRNPSMQSVAPAVYKRKENV